MLYFTYYLCASPGFVFCFCISFCQFQLFACFCLFQSRTCQCHCEHKLMGYLSSLKAIADSPSKLLCIWLTRKKEFVMRSQFTLGLFEPCNSTAYTCLMLLKQGPRCSELQSLSLFFCKVSFGMQKSFINSFSRKKIPCQYLQQTRNHRYVITVEFLFIKPTEYL